MTPWLAALRSARPACTAVALALLGALAGAAHAQPGASPPPPSPAPPPQPAPDRGSVHHREGFYVSVGLGAGMASVTHRYQGQGTLGSNRTGLFAFGFTVGGTLGHTVLGGTALMVGTGDMEDAAGVTDHGMAMLIGPSIDWFPSRTGGLQVGAMLGAGAGDVPFAAAGTDARAVGGGLWVGYSWWVGDEWSIGARLQLVGATATTTNLRTVLGTEAERSARFATWALTATAVYQ